MSENNATPGGSRASKESKALYHNLDGSKVHQTEVQVESATLLFIDPCVLFEDEEWREMCRKDDLAKEVEKALKEKFKLTAGCIHTMEGDGSYRIRRTEDGVLVEHA